MINCDKIEEVTNKWKDIKCSWIGSINIVTMSILPRMTYEIHATPIKIPRTLFTNIEKSNLKFA